MLGSVVRERVFDNSNNFNQRILGLLPETARSMLPFSFESENRTVRGILSRGGRELLVTLQILIEVPHIHAIAACGRTTRILLDMVMGQPEPVLVTEQAVEVVELVVRLLFGLNTK